MCTIFLSVYQFDFYFNLTSTFKLLLLISLQKIMFKNICIQVFGAFYSQDTGLPFGTKHLLLCLHIFFVIIIIYFSLIKSLQKHTITNYNSAPLTVSPPPTVTTHQAHVVYTPASQFGTGLSSPHSDKRSLDSPDSHKGTAIFKSFKRKRKP